MQKVKKAPWANFTLGFFCTVNTRRTGAFDLLSPLQGRLLVVYWLAGQGEDPDLCHFAHHVLLVAAQRQDLAALRRVLHHLPGS